TLYKIIEESTGQDYEKIEKDCDRDYTLTAEEALDYGIVDEIIRSHKNGRK
ncbi:MAG: ATP-dependent Clp protease proteolytic subunit, partial [Lachnospiraceae bacterium]|nr:ATP-dependent Clp protease proteolytic subunit [Lachnospiraceae bacterium]